MLSLVLSLVALVLDLCMGRGSSLAWLRSVGHVSVSVSLKQTPTHEELQMASAYV